MTITYDFIAFSGRLSDNRWTLGMKAIQGEVPLDIVLPNMQVSDSEENDIIGVLTKEGIARESTDVMELYRYLRQLNPKTNQAFGYNEVAIRNIHTHLNSLKVDQELRVQITYSERKESYIAASYNIKLLGISPLHSIESQDLDTDISEEIESTQPEENMDVLSNDMKETPTDVLSNDMKETPTSEEKSIIPTDFSSTTPDIPVYKTTNTLEKLIAFTRSLQAELKDATDKLTLMTERLQSLEEQQQRYREQDKLLQEIYDQLNILDNFDKRINSIETDFHQLDKWQQTLVTYFKISNRQTRALLQEVDDDPDNSNSENQPDYNNT